MARSIGVYSQFWKAAASESKLIRLRAPLPGVCKTRDSLTACPSKSLAGAVLLVAAVDNVA